MKLLSKFYYFICLAMVGITSGYSQQIIWEKQFGWIASPDVFTSVCEADSGGYMGLGYSDKNLIGSSIVTGWGFNIASITKFNSTGDTLFSRELNLLCQSWGTPYIGRFWSNLYVAVINVEQPNGSSSSNIRRFPAVLLINSQGEVVQSKFFPQHEFCIITGVKKTKDEGLMLSGYKSSLDIFHTDSIFAMKVNFLLEQEWAYKYTNIANAAFRGEHLEPMANGNYLVSGKLGKRIYGMEVDTNGWLVNEKIYYQNPDNIIMLRGEVYQVWRKWYLSYGTYRPTSNTYKMPLVLSDSLGNKVWGGEAPNISGSVFVNKELSFIHAWGDGSNIFLTRLKSDSSIIWNLNLGSLSQQTKWVNAIYFSDNDTGVVVGGFQNSTGNLGSQFWIAKIAGVGTAYDPSHPDDTVTVSAQEKVFRPKDSPILYPNPSTETIRFQKLTRETLLSIYSTKGEKILDKAILPDEVLDVCVLPRGYYLYHLKMGERVFTGKFLKR